MDNPSLSGENEDARIRSMANHVAHSLGAAMNTLGDIQTLYSGDDRRDQLRLALAEISPPALQAKADALRLTWAFAVLLDREAKRCGVSAPSPDESLAEWLSERLAPASGFHFPKLPSVPL